MPGPRAVGRRGGIVDFQLEDGSIVPVAIEHAPAELQQLAATAIEAAPAPAPVVSPTDAAPRTVGDLDPRRARELSGPPRGLPPGHRMWIPDEAPLLTPEQAAAAAQRLSAVSPTDATRPAVAAVSPTDAAGDVWSALERSATAPQRLGGPGASDPIANYDPREPTQIPGLDAPSHFDAGRPAAVPDVPPAPRPGVTPSLAQVAPPPAPSTGVGMGDVREAERAAPPAADPPTPGPTFDPGQPQQRGGMQMSPLEFLQATGALGGRGGGGGGGPRTTTTVRSTAARPVSPETQTDLAVSGAMVEDATREAGETTARWQEGQAATLEQQQRQLDEIERGRQRREQDRQDQARMQRRRLETAIAAARDQRLDEDRFFTEGGTPTRILGALAVGIGEAGAALTGGPNAALEIINSAISDEIDAQRENMAEAGRAVDRESGMLSQMMQLFGDERAAEAATKAAYLERAAMEAERLRALAASEETRAQLDVTIAAIRRQQAELRAQVEQAAQPEVTTETVIRAGGGSGGRRPLSVGDALRVYEAQQEFQGGAGGGPRIPGLEVADPEVARTLRPETIDRLRGEAGTYLDLEDAAGALVRLREEHGAEILGHPAMVQQQNRAIRALSVLEQAGALGDEERDWYRSQIQDASSTDPRTMDRLREFQQRVRATGTARFRPFGFRPSGPVRPQSAQPVE